MATTQKVRVVMSDAGVIVLNEEMDCSATGDQLFNVLNVRCEFAKWAVAAAYVNEIRSEVFNSQNATENQASATTALSLALARVAAFGTRCRFAIHLSKLVAAETNTDGPVGPIQDTHPGILGHRGPAAGQPGTYTPKPDGPATTTLAKMRGMLL
jgi:hypothetical protein